ncbi:MAG: DUF3119 family protein [Cyanobacteria bacterium P01_C01_bin.70]
MTASSTIEATTLEPSYNIPLFLIVGGLAGVGLTWGLWGSWQAVLAGIVPIFGLFLLYQAKTLRLVFTASDLDIYRGDTRIRQFPYAEWKVWDIFWPPVPILFYFREVNSIHFLPILFSPKDLRSQLERHVPNPTESQ